MPGPNRIFSCAYSHGYDERITSGNLGLPRQCRDFSFAVELISLKFDLGRGQHMILAPLTAAALMLSVATAPNVAPKASSELSVGQKNAAAQKLVRTATDCIAQTVAADPRFRTQADLGDLIVDSMPA